MGAKFFLAVVVCAFAILATTACAQVGWQQQTPSLSPPPRGYHAMDYDESRGVCVLFGGSTGSGMLGDTWEWDGFAWTQRFPSNSPSARCCHVMAYDLARRVTVLFGGFDSNGILDDTWEWDGTNWRQVATTSPAPPARATAAMVYSLNFGTMVLFGGEVDASNRFDDTWEWDGVQWTQRFPTTRPSARFGHGLVADPTNGGVVLYGGSIQPQTHLSDQWLWNGADWQLMDPVAAPGLRSRTRMRYQLSHGTSIMFGGFHGPGLGGSNDTWILSGDRWTQDPRPGPSPRVHFAMAYDTLRDRVVVFGGLPGSLATTFLSDTWEYDPSGQSGFETFGPACGGVQGDPQIHAPDPRPILGAPFTVELSNLPAHGPAWIAVGFSSSFWLGLALPASLAPVGMPQCALLTSQEGVVGFVDTGGVASLQLNLPLENVLIGAPFYQQGFAFELGAGPLNLLVSNAGAGVFGVF